MLLAVILGGILVQVGTGYDIDIFQYLFGLFAFSIPCGSLAC